MIMFRVKYQIREKMSLNIVFESTHCFCFISFQRRPHFNEIAKHN